MTMLMYCGVQSGSHIYYNPVTCRYAIKRMIGSEEWWLIDLGYVYACSQLSFCGLLDEIEDEQGQITTCYIPY